MQIEQVRERVALLTKCIEQLDEFTSNIVEARWKFEMLQTNPQLGINGQQPTTSADMAKNIDAIEAQRSTAALVLLAQIGTETLDAARERYVGVVTALQHYGSLLDLHRMVSLDIPAAIEQARTLYKLDAALDALDVLARTEQEVEEAKYAIVNMADELPMSDLIDYPAPVSKSFIIHGV